MKPTDDDLRPEYDFSNATGVRGKHAPKDNLSEQMRTFPVTKATHPESGLTLDVCIVDPAVVRGWSARVQELEREVARLKDDEELISKGVVCHDDGTYIKTLIIKGTIRGVS